MNKITYNNLADFLISNFSEFTEYDKESLNLPHVIVGNFAELLVRGIEKNPNDDFISRAFNLINDLFSKSDDSKLMDLIQIELFENLAQSEKAVLFSRGKLKGKAIEYFEKAMNGFGIKSMRLRK